MTLATQLDSPDYAEIIFAYLDTDLGAQPSEYLDRNGWIIPMADAIQREYGWHYLYPRNTIIEVLEDRIERYKRGEITPLTYDCLNGFGYNWAWSGVTDEWLAEADLGDLATKRLVAYTSQYKLPYKPFVLRDTDPHIRSILNDYLVHFRLRQKAAKVAQGRGQELYEMFVLFGNSISNEY